MSHTTPRTTSGPLQSIDVAGPTIAQAVQKALTALHVARHQVRVKILSEGQPGLFGMRGKKPAKIRVTLKTAHEPKLPK